MRVAVLLSSYEGVDSVFKDHDQVPVDVVPFAPAGTDFASDIVPIVKARAREQVQALALSGRYAAYINLCDGAPDEDRAGIEVVEALEEFGLPYTGGDPTFYTQTKEYMKATVARAGVDTPRSVFAFDGAAVQVAAATLRFPLIVKHFNGYGSIGMTEKSRVTTPAELAEQAGLFLQRFGGALIEEFVEGREFTVLVAENPDDATRPLAYMPVECHFGRGQTFKHFELKWIDCEEIKWAQAADAALNERIMEMGRRAFVALDGVSYGRIDLRVDAAGTPFFLEMNPNCGIFYARPQDFGSADHILSQDRLHGGHWGFIQTILRAAHKRCQRSQASQPASLAALATSDPQTAACLVNN